MKEERENRDFRGIGFFGGFFGAVVIICIITFGEQNRSPSSHFG